MSEIVVFGATGFTGTLVAECLHERGLPFAVGGRNPKKLAALSERLGGAPIRVADAEQPHTLNQLTKGSRVIINCAGPFLRYGEPVVNAAVESGVHYLDTTGEQTWMKRILNRYDGIALRQQVTVINAVAFEYSVGDWLAALAAQRLGRPEERIDSISVGYSLTGGGITQGTALSVFEMLGELGWSYEGGHWQRRPAGWTRRTMPFPFGEREVAWVPFGETLHVPLHEKVQTVLTFMRVPKQAALALPTLNRLGPALRPLMRPLAERYIAQQPAGPTDEQRRATRFALTAEARRTGEVALASATGADPYGLTARVATLAAELLLTEGSVPRGVRAPAHLPIDPAEALTRIGAEVG